MRGFKHGSTLLEPIDNSPATLLEGSYPVHGFGLMIGA